MISLTKYPGGKAYLLPDIMQVFNSVDASCVVEPFGGSAKFLLNVPVMSLYGKRKVVYNDYDNRISNMFLVVKDYPEELEAKFEYVIQSREWFNKFKSPVSDPIEDAFRTLYCLLLGRPERTFDVMGWTRQNRNDIEGVQGRIKDVHNIIKDWVIENRSFQEVIEAWDSTDTFFYLDPPYLGTNMYNYNFTYTNMIMLKNVLSRVKGKYILNHTAHNSMLGLFGEPQMRKIYNNAVNSKNKVNGYVVPDREEWFYWKL